MWLRKAFFRWLFPAAAVLPLWLFIGWGIFQAGGWAFVWVLLMAVPSVLIGQIVLTLLVRARPSVRAERAVSWLDVLGFAVWHALVIAVGCFPQGWFGWALAGAIVVFIALFWSSLAQLWNEARGRGSVVITETAWVPPSGSQAPFGSPAGERPAPTGNRAQSHDVYVITEVREDPQNPSRPSP
ncbi:hypothetical protein JOD62_000173 [Microbacterium keratanolyticum]|uniref:MFS transporter permease n=1 Tax=Microbacterium keratanolyticum TaxID=67574 RepID=A0A9W6M9H7_9MICO|nr:MFS transporter permease [Microbacterium keratanolyticum]MBM7467625.1 hypothetical protein [Microbacterium keratanolyticum]GLK02617.1 hypothetical protein GCM10017596_23320 [Microbacterium keratanolyticum]